jgi:UDP-N-acetylmuramoylalanine--D-glutamate ligase
MFSTITALEHRLEAFYHDNITWINDSKATNIEATIAGVQSLEKIHVLLLGGAGKEGANYSMLQDLLEKKCTNVICFGASGTEIFNSLSTLSSIYKTIDLASAIELANKISDRGDIILLSPACASFDEFSNFGHRGKVFTAHVRSLPLTRGDS